MADGAAEGRRRPLYARLLRLHRLRPGPVLCFVFLEGAIALGILLALANLASWWTVLALPAAVAVMVKLNDVVAGATARKPTARKAPVTKVAPEREEKREEKELEKPDWPLPGNPSKPLIEDEEEEDVDEGEEVEDEEEQEEDTEKTEPPEATRSESDESVTRPAS